jgi:UDP-2,4-diacetamido-2,4,6-trideoxy-beta-L-altropyranose hydrolase
MRCLTLADALRSRGEHCRFICRDHSGNLFDMIEKRGFPFHVLPKAREHILVSEARSESAPEYLAWLGVDWKVDAQQTIASLDGAQVDWLIVDQYALDARWEKLLRPHCKKLLVIDDLANRPHVSDVLLDQNLGREAKDYDGLLPDNCIRLIGPQNALLQPEFADLREFSLRRRKNPVLRHVLISMGGVDKPNATGQVLEALKSCLLPIDCKLTVVMGGKALWTERVRTIAATMIWPTEVRTEITDMAQVMAESDLAIGAAGATAWERCCLGLPAIVVVLTSNQYTGACALQAAGAASLIGGPTAIYEQLPPALVLLMKGEAFERMSRLASNITNGQGAVRVVEYISHPQ